MRCPAHRSRSKPARRYSLVPKVKIRSPTTTWGANGATISGSSDACPQAWHASNKGSARMRELGFRAAPLRIARLEPGALLIIVFAMAAFVMAQLYDPDYFWHLRTGQLILDAHAIPRHDPFSFTRPYAPWLVNAWLFDVLM